MKLLMITRKVDRQEHLAGFIYNWVKKLAAEVDELRVISWQEGDSSGLPDNVKVTHLKTKQNKFLKIITFEITVWKNLKNVDGVLCHQMPIYTILVAPLTKLRGKKVVSWYAHSSVSFKLRLMEKLSNVIVTSSAKGFRLPSKKVVIVGQGIDTEKFKPGSDRNHTSNFISIGRISPIKNYELMIKAINILTQQGVKDLSLTIIGEAGLGAQSKYFESLKEMVGKMKREGKIKFLGSVPNNQILEYLQQADVFLNLSATGSLDKAILEAMACECLVLTSNEAYIEILPQDLMVDKDDPEKLAEKIKLLIQMPPKKFNTLRKELRNIVVQNHNLDNLVKNIVEQFN